MPGEPLPLLVGAPGTRRAGCLPGLQKCRTWELEKTTRVAREPVSCEDEATGDLLAAPHRPPARAHLHRCVRFYCSLGPLPCSRFVTFPVTLVVRLPWQRRTDSLAQDMPSLSHPTAGRVAMLTTRLAADVPQAQADAAPETPMGPQRLKRRPLVFPWLHHRHPDSREVRCRALPPALKDLNARCSPQRLQVHCAKEQRGHSFSLELWRHRTAWLVGCVLSRLLLL